MTEPGVRTTAVSFGGYFGVESDAVLLGASDTAELALRAAGLMAGFWRPLGERLSTAEAGRSMTCNQCGVPLKPSAHRWRRFLPGMLMQLLPSGRVPSFADGCDRGLVAGQRLYPTRTFIASGTGNRCWSVCRSRASQSYEATTWQICACTCKIGLGRCEL